MGFTDDIKLSAVDMVSRDLGHCSPRCGSMCSHLSNHVYRVSCRDELVELFHSAGSKLFLAEAQSRACGIFPMRRDSLVSPSGSLGYRPLSELHSWRPIDDDS